MTEEVRYEGLRCVFLRAGTEHHAVALYPIELRERLGLSPHSTTFSVGMQVGTYRQLRDARTYLLGNGMTEQVLPPELFPGIPRAFRFRDPDGHLVELYDTVRQVFPRQPAGTAPTGWPETIDDDAFDGEPYLGPLE